MRRTVWFSLVCLIGLALLVSVRALAPFASKAAPKIPDSFDTEDTSPLAVKSDRLVAADDEVVPDKATIKTVKVVFPASAPKEDARVVAPQRSAYASMRGRHHHPTHRLTKKRHRHRR
jgi:hypothetical protein